MQNILLWDRLVLFLYTSASIIFAIAACVRLGAVPYSVEIESNSFSLLHLGNILRVPAAGINILASLISLLVDSWVLRMTPPKHIFDFPASIIQLISSCCFGIGAGCIVGHVIDTGSIFWLIGSVGTFLSTSLLLYVQIIRTFQNIPCILMNTPLFISVCFWSGSIFFITGSSIYIAQGLSGLLSGEICLIIGSLWYLLGISTDIYFGIQNFVNTRRTKL